MENTKNIYLIESQKNVHKKTIQYEKPVLNESGNITPFKVSEELLKEIKSCSYETLQDIISTLTSGKQQVTTQEETAA